MFLAFLVVVVVGVSAQMTCSMYEPGCTEISVPTCNTATKTCYAHPNVCGSLRAYLLNIPSGYTIVVSSYSFNCTTATLAQCSNETAITATTVLATSPRFCVPSGVPYWASGITIRTLGSFPAAIFTPAPAINQPSCSGITFLGSNIALQNIIIDMTFCTAVLNASTTGIVMSGTGLNLTNVYFNSTPIMVALSGPVCDNIVFNIVSALPVNAPALFSPFDLPIALVASVCSNTVPIYSTTILPYFAITSSPITLVNSSSFIVVDFGTLLSETVFKPVSPPCTAVKPSCPGVTPVWVYVIVPVVFVVALIGMFWCSHAAKRVSKLTKTS